jgi:hypothetical protein
LQAVEISTVTFIPVPPLPHDIVCVLVEGRPGTQATLSVLTEQLLVNKADAAHWPVKPLLLSTRQRPSANVVKGVQVKIADACFMLPFEESTTALIVTGPPTATQSASPVDGSIVTIVESEEVHAALKFACVVGVWLKVPVTLNATCR